jgi:AcrR family transcriptional regulator
LRKRVSERRREVFFAISDIISSKGLSEVSTIEIAKRLGVTQPALYKYFKSKDDMIIYFLDELKQYLLNILKETEKGKTTFEKLKIIYEKHLELIQKTKILPRVIFSDEIYIGNDNKRKKLKEVIESYTGGVKRIIEEGIKKGEIKKDVDSDLIVRFILGSMISSALVWFLNNYNFDLRGESEKLIKELEKMIKI